MSMVRSEEAGADGLPQREPGPRPRAAGAPLRLACVCEQAIGHVTFQANLAGHLARWPDVAPTWYPLPYAAAARWPPRWLNWTLRAGLMARAALRGAAYDALLFHTQVPALLCPDHLGRAPALLSMDATPAQNARLGIYVGRSQRRALSRYAARRWVSAGLRRAYRVVAWSDWVRRSLIQEYGLRDEQIEVLPPGIDVGLWQVAAGAAGRRSGGRGTALPRILFVGGDLGPKGGVLLLDCFRRHWRRRAELHLVTRTPVAAEPGVVVHHGLTPNAPELRRLFRESDLFVLPTFGDAFAHVVLEAMASGLPVVASAVGAIPEVVEHGRTGLLVPAGGAGPLAAAVEALLEDPAERQRMGEAGWARARERFDGARSGRRLVEILLRAREERA